VDLDDLVRRKHEFDPLIAMHKLKNFLSKSPTNDEGFQIPQTPNRELLSHQMVDQVEDKKRRIMKARKKKIEDKLTMAKGTPRIKTGTKYDTLSDAAKRFASSVRGGSSIRPMSITRRSANKISDKITPRVSKKL
jgi:hypothetical protein